MRYLSICAVLRNEAPYLKEWLDFYFKQGVEHFYLYDNESNDNPQKLLEEYGQKITWHTSTGLCQQRVAYNHTVRQYRKCTEWCVFVDIDEFLYSSKHPRFVDTLRNKYDVPGVSGVAVHWLLFGSSGKDVYEPEPVTKRFTMRAEAVNHHVKSIMRLADTYSMGLDPHTFRAHETIIDENFTPMPLDYAIISPATADILRVNHYVTKSKEEYRARKLLPDANTGEIKDFEKMWAAHDVNEVEDTRIWEVL